MDEYHETYVRGEIQRALAGHPERHALTLKITGDEASSKWLNVTVPQVRAIRELICTDTPDLEAIRAILSEDRDEEPAG